MAQKKSRWWPARRGTIRIFPVLLAVGNLLFTAVGFLLFVVSVYYVTALKNEILLVLGAALVAAAIVVLIRIGQHYEWTGFGESVRPKPDDQEIQPRKTLWDWLQLLIVPLALAAIGLWFTMQQDARQGDIEEQRADDAALQAYLDQMNDLLLEHNLRNSKEDSGVRTLAKARTSTVLARLDPSGKGQVVQFLAEADLIHSVGGKDPIIALSGAPLGDADLSPPGRGISLQGAILSEADLSGADLGGADLRGADLTRVNLSSADLDYAYLDYAYLDSANLEHANLMFTQLDNAYLGGASLDNAKLPYADLEGTNLQHAYLEGARLHKADLSGAFGVTREMLVREAKFLKGATMPGTPMLPPPQQFTATQLPTDIPAGEYVTDEFKSSFRFEVGEGWVTWSETLDSVEVDRLAPERGQLIFTSPRHIFDPSNLSEPKEAPTPENAEEWVSWFQNHPNLETSHPQPVKVGNAAGMRIDVTETSAPENYSQDYCGKHPCVPLFPISNSAMASLFPNSNAAITSYGEVKDRFIIVDVAGETVVIDVAAPADKFDEFLLKAQKVLNTVDWSES